MTLLKGLLAVLVLLVVVLMGGLLLPASSHLERSVVIERPPAEVFVTLDSFQRFNRGSIWIRMRNIPAAVRTPVWARRWPGRGTVRSAAADRKSSKVRLTATSSTRSTSVAARPRPATLVAEGSGTRVIWNMDSAHAYNPVKRWFGAFLLDRVVGKDYEKGLAKLKPVLESGPRR